MVACSGGSSADRTAAWREDLHALATELPKRHKNAFFRVAAADWNHAIEELDRALPTLDDAHVLAGFARVVAMLGDAHTIAGVWGRGGYEQLKLAWYDDGVYVVAGEHVGQRVERVGGVAIDDAIGKLAPLVSRENDAGLHAQLPLLLVDKLLLAGVGLAPEYGFARDAALVPPKQLPLALSGPPGYAYWNKADGALLYFAYHKCAEDPKAGPIASLIAGTLGYIDAHAIERVVVDLRHNQGGDSSLIQPLVDGLAARPKLRVYAIIGMETFSSGVLAAIDLKRRARAKLVGQATAGRPNSYGEIKTFELPRSKIVVQYSTKLFSFPDFPGDSLRPDLVVPSRAADWFAGRDAALDAIRADP